MYIYSDVPKEERCQSGASVAIDKKYKRDQIMGSDQ